MKNLYYILLPLAILVFGVNPQIASAQPPPEDLKVDEAYIVNKVNHEVYLELSHDTISWGSYEIGMAGSGKHEVFYENLSNQNLNRERYGFLRVYTPGTSDYLQYEVIARRRYMLIYRDGKVQLQQMTL
ncbi:MAG: hypothetical protein AAFQ83_21040 [Bacteroidota bacterium]